MKRALLSKALAARVGDLKRDMERRARGESVFTHVPTGFPTFDEKFGGLEIGILTLILGHTGDGKTALLGHLARAAAEAGFGVLLLLLEDPQDKLADRYLAGVMGESANAISRLQVDDPARFDAALDETEVWSKRVGLVTGQMTAKDCLALVKETAEKGVAGAPLGLVIVDYAQSFGVDEGGMEQVCADLAWGLNALAGDHRLAIALGSQVASDVHKRGRARWEWSLRSGPGDEGGFMPGKGDAMWSRRLEQYAKAVWYIFRPGRWRRECGDLAAKDNVFRIKIGKANFSPEGEHNFTWHGPTTTIHDRPPASA